MSEAEASFSGFWIGVIAATVVGLLGYFATHASIHIQWEWKP